MKIYTEKYIDIFLNEKYKTDRAKKMGLTSWIKGTKELIEDYKTALKDAKKRGKPYGWLLGERIFPHTLKNQERELKNLISYKEKYHIKQKK